MELRKLSDYPLALRVDDVQKILGIGRVTAFNLIHSPGFPVIRVSPRRLVIPRDHFARWLDEQTNQESG